MKKSLLFTGILCAFLTAVFLISCGNSGSTSGSGGVSSGSVVLYATDAPGDDYKQVTMTLNRVQLVHTGRGDSCTLLDTPETMDITDLSSKLQLLNMVDCNALNYNRVRVEFEKAVTLTDKYDVTAGCGFKTYKGKGNQPNVLQCEGNVCTVDINGAVNVLSGENNNVALDFDLKEFEVIGFNEETCSVAMKVSPLNASGIAKKKHDEGYHEGISGRINSIDQAAQSFVMTSRNMSYTVSYAGITQEGIEDILDLALNEELKVIVDAAFIDPETGEIDASSVYLKVKGTISDLDTVNETFTLTYRTDNTMTVHYNGAETEGIPADGLSVEVKLDGYDGSMYHATEVEVEVCD